MKGRFFGNWFSSVGLGDCFGFGRKFRGERERNFFVGSVLGNFFLVKLIEKYDFRISCSSMGLD